MSLEYNCHLKAIAFYKVSVSVLILHGGKGGQLRLAPPRRLFPAIPPTPSLNEGVRSLELLTLTTRDLGSVNPECFHGHSVHWEPESRERGKK